MSGPPIECFTREWAVRVSFGSHPSVAHYYVRDQLSWVYAVCGAPSARAGALRGLGTWKKCKRCEAKLAKDTTKGTT